MFITIKGRNYRCVSAKPEVLTCDELFDLAWIVKAAENMRTEFEKIEPVLWTLKSDRAVNIYTTSREYRHTINRCKQIVQQKMKTIKIDRNDLNWQRVLPFYSINIYMINSFYSILMAALFYKKTRG